MAHLPISEMTASLGECSSSLQVLRPAYFWLHCYEGYSTVTVVFTSFLMSLLILPLDAHLMECCLHFASYAAHIPLSTKLSDKFLLRMSSAVRFRHDCATLPRLHGQPGPPSWCSLRGMRCA